MEFERALISAIQAGNLEDAHQLLATGRTPNFADDAGNTPLMFAVANWSFLDGIKSLLEAGADVAAKNEQGLTAIHVAVELGQVEALQMVLAKGGDINAHDQNGLTPLQVATMLDNANKVTVLLESGADIEAANRAGQRALHYAADCGRDGILKLLLERGARPDVRDDNGHTPYQLALQHEDLACIGLLSAPKPLATEDSRSKPRDITAVLNRLEQSLKIQRPAYHALLNPGVDPSELDRVEGALGFQLPTEFRQLYLWHNGSSKWKCFQDNQNFMSIQQVLAAHGLLTEMIGADFTEPNWWSRRWVPFLESAGGNHLCMDMAGSFGRKARQIVEFVHDASDRPILAPDLGTWLDAFVSAIEAGEWKEKEGMYEGEMRPIPGYPVYEDAERIHNQCLERSRFATKR
jgi:ankyrin repeat protein